MRPTGLLLSEVADAAWAQQIDAVAAGAGVSLRRFTPREADPAAIDLAFFSRDLYVGGSLRAPSAASDAFFAVADAAPRLRWLHVFSVGTDLPQYQRALARGVATTGSRGVSAGPIAQSTVAAMVGLSRGFGHWLAAQRERRWSPLQGDDRPRDLEGQRAVVVGAGTIGLDIGRLLGAFGFHTTAVRQRGGPTPPFDDSVTIDRLDQLLPSCDWLVLACPLTEATRHLVDARRIAMLPPTAAIANIGRGELVDQPALVAALQDSRLAAAFLDVVDPEPLPDDSPLWTLPGVWLTPHNCGASRGHEARVAACFLAELRRRLVPSSEPTP